MKTITSYLFIFTLILGVGMMACSDSKPAVNSGQLTTQPTPHWKRDVNAEDIARLKWLEGTWKGTGEGQEPFYEKYRFEGTTMLIDNYSDASLQTITDTAKYALVNGEFRHTEDGRRSVASEISENHVQFVPAVGPGNSYRFERQPEGKWRAVLEWPATAEKPARQVVYNMEPYKK